MHSVERGTLHTGNLFNLSASPTTICEATRTSGFVTELGGAPGCIRTGGCPSCLLEATGQSPGHRTVSRAPVAAGVANSHVEPHPGNRRVCDETLPWIPSRTKRRALFPAVAQPPERPVEDSVGIDSGHRQLPSHLNERRLPTALARLSGWRAGRRQAPHQAQLKVGKQPFCWWISCVFFILPAS